MANKITNMDNYQKIQYQAAEHEFDQTFINSYQIDQRPLCAGVPFALTDVAHPRVILKYLSNFLVLDNLAGVPACNTLGYGYYRNDTRYLSQWEMQLNHQTLSLLSASTRNGFLGSFLYTNHEIDNIPQQKITINREIIVNDLVWEKIIVQNYFNQDLDIVLSFNFQSDYADMFEIRGLDLSSRGLRMMPVVGSNNTSMYLAYVSIDNQLSETKIEFFGLNKIEFNVSEGIIDIPLHLTRNQLYEFQICMMPELKKNNLKITGFNEARTLVQNDYKTWLAKVVSLKSDNAIFDATIHQSLADLFILRQPTPNGIGLAAGIPWYTALFGRDSAICALEIMPFAQDLAKECIEVLAKYQGQKYDKFTGEEPGKIMHELRLGDLARQKLIPHTPYYGTADATQLWLMAFASYINWSGNLDFAKQYWPCVEMALTWIDNSLNDRGYITYKSTGDHDLVNQGWKDSQDSIMHKSGDLAKPPIALCEVQAYIYAAWTQIAKLAATLAKPQLAKVLKEKATALKNRFIKDFWLYDLQYIAMALDADNEPTRVLSSNAGHCLYAGILDNDIANIVCDKLMSSDLYSNWGLRTLAKSCTAYNPMSYHNGTIWPHDNALIAQGMAHYGRIADAHKLICDIYEVAKLQPNYRLPELFCGFKKQEMFDPVQYPVSCSPQAFASAAMFQFMQICLNMKPDALNSTLHIDQPQLPDFFNYLNINGLRLGNAVIDLSFAKVNQDTVCNILKKSGQVKVLIEK